MVDFCPLYLFLMKYVEQLHGNHISSILKFPEHLENVSLVCFD